MRIRPVVAIALLSIASVPSIAESQTGRPLAIEDYYRLRELGSPEISPDARWVAFTLGRRIEATNGTESEVWLVATDGSSPARRVSPAGVNATAPSWRDDGRLRFATGRLPWFVDPAVPDRVDSTIVDSTGGPRRGGGPGGGGFAVPQSSPDGRWMAFVRDVPPPKRARPAMTEFEQRAEEHFRGVSFDFYPFMGDGRPFPLPNRNDPEVSPPQEIFVSATADPSGAKRPQDDMPSAARQLTRLGLRPTGVGWSPDGKSIAFTADSAYREERKYGRSEIWVVNVADGALRRLTPNVENDYTGARYSPDGRWILTTRGLADDHIIAAKLDHGGATDLVLVPAPGGAEVNLTADWDYLPTAPFWSKDGKYVYFGGGVGGTTHLFRVPASGGTVEQITKGERRLGGFSYDRTFTTMAYTMGVMERPSEIWVANFDGSGERQLTHVFDDFTREVALSKSERLLYKSADGTQIEGWLVFPYGYRPDGGPYPLVVASHGGPHSADGYGFNFKNQYLAANGYFVLHTNFRSSTGYGEKFLWGTWGGWGNKDGQDVMAGVDLVQSRYPIDRAHTAAIGHSYGGFMTNWLITQYPDRFAAAIPGAGIVNWMSDYGNADIPITKEKEFWGAPWDPKARETMLRQSPLTYANRVKAATLFIVGEIDQRVPYSETQQMYTALKKNGVPAKVIRYAGMPHGISGHWNQVHRMLNERRWLDSYLRARSLSP